MGDTFNRVKRGLARIYWYHKIDGSKAMIIFDFMSDQKRGLGYHFMCLGLSFPNVSSINQIRGSILKLLAKN